MITHMTSAVPWGMKASPVEVEVDISLGIPQLTIVGLPDQAVKESKDRVRSAIKNSGFEFPLKKITVNLAPADLKKEGPLFDLPIALSILAAEGHINLESLKNCLAIGELSLDGKLRAVKGMIQAGLLAISQNKRLLFADGNLREASFLDEFSAKNLLIPLPSLREAVIYLKEGFCKNPLEIIPPNVPSPQGLLDFEDVKGQKRAKRALEIAVSGGHNLLMLGPPGGGKTMLAQRISGILPSLTRKEAREIAMVHSVSDESQLFNSNFFERPFRGPHHSLSTASLVGGGALPKPGEVSLAHGGVLFLDELSEFKKDALESLRAPLEDKKILISRVSGSLEFPASFVLVAASNPCPCGYSSSRFRACRCSLSQMEQFRRRLSGPLIDRIDIHVEVPELDWEELRNTKKEESSETVRKRVEQAHQIQRDRYKDFPFSTNSALNEKGLKLFCPLDKESEAILRQAMKELGLSARAHSRILKIARTLADMENAPTIETHHLEEAIGYRILDRQFIYV